MRNIEACVGAYLSTKASLEALKEQEFPRGAVVAYGGQHTIRVVDPEERPDSLALRFENGNVWIKPLIDCRPEPNPDRWPGWVRRYFD